MCIACAGLLFQMGKFYEIFEMDAHIGVKELDLQYMKVNIYYTFDFPPFSVFFC